jgi:hypothetical protein
LSRTTFGAFYILKSQLLVGEGKPHVGLVPCSPDGGTTHVTTRHDKRRDRGRTLKRKYTVIEAAKVLGVGTDAVRKRVARGTVEHERVEDTVYVWLDDRHANGTDIRHDGSTNGDGAELLDVYRDQLDAYKDQVGYLRSQLDQERRANDENRRLLAALIQRVPELEAGADPPTSSEAYEDGAQGPANGAGGPSQAHGGR